MKFFAILHIPTNSLFPMLACGSSFYNFHAPPSRIRHFADRPPRLFESKRMANRYITEYCKGIRKQDSFVAGKQVQYTDPPYEPPRSLDHFQVIEIEIVMSKE